MYIHLNSTKAVFYLGIKLLKEVVPMEIVIGISTFNRQKKEGVIL
jgi:hypothetical protein